MIFFLVLEEWVRAAAVAAVNQLWQGVAVAAGLAVCLRLAPRTRASHRFALWLAAFGTLVALPVLTPWVMGWLEGARAAGAPVASAGPWLRIDPSWGLWIVGAWAAMAAARLTMLAAGAMRARKLWKEAVPVEVRSSHPSSRERSKDGAPGDYRSHPSDKNKDVARVGHPQIEGLDVLVAARLWGRGRVEICRTELLERPCVIGFFRPRILVPGWLLERMTEGELRQVVLHEMEHLRRLDDWTNLAQKLAVALLPLNVALVWMDRELGREREMACDEGVVRRTRAPRAYAACLAALAERGLEMKMLRQAEALALGAWRRRPELAERVMSLLRGKETLGTAGRAALAGALAAGLAVATVGLARAPQLVGFAPEGRPAEMAANASFSPISVQNAEMDGAPRAFSEVGAATPAVRKRFVKAAARPAAESVEPAGNESAEMVVPVMARMEPVQVEMDRNQGWVVLAVWVERVSVQGRVVADYDVPPTADVHGKQVVIEKLPVAPVEARVHAGWVVFEL
ncbi:MAG: M56 family metallopeptidase [Terracidiphilus sp.]|nr:M56 family metallopeptidase [Terracidiphilus sp.]